MESDSTPFGIHQSLPDVVSAARYEGIAPNNENVKVAIVIPAAISQPIYGDIIAEVKCFSRVKPGALYRGMFPLGPLTEQQAKQKAGIVAGAMAENLCANYKDNLNAVEWARDAIAAFDEALKRFARAMPTPPPRDNSLDEIFAALQAFRGKSSGY